MPASIISSSVAAGASVDLLNNTQYQFLPFHALVEFGLCTPLTGCLATIYAGTDLLMEEGPVDLKAASQLPVYPDNFHVNDEVAAGDKLKCQVRNTTASAAVVNLVLRINPL